MATNQRLADYIGGSVSSTRVAFFVDLGPLRAKLARVEAAVVELDAAWHDLPPIIREQYDLTITTGQLPDTNSDEDTPC